MKGIYVLIIKVKNDSQINIGKLGLIKFVSGTYVYVGSAQNNLIKRINRHINKDKKIRWHIDYLLTNRETEIIKVLYKESGKEEECRIAAKLSENNFFIPKFGSSDCKCNSHLIKINNLNIINDLKFTVY